MALTVDCSTWTAVGLSSACEGGMMSVRAWFAFATLSAVRFGELSLCCSMILMAACSSAKFSNCRPRESLLSSSSLEFCVESGGEMTAPAGIFASSVTGGGDCLRLPLEVRLLLSLFSLSAVPGGVGSCEGWKWVVFTEVVRRCRVRYDVDLGNSGLLLFECGNLGR
jgi:hypothetical protein